MSQSDGVSSSSTPYVANGHLWFPPFASTPPVFSLDGWQDITEKFTNAAKTLRLGELVNDNSFSLFEGMSAIELMDPKMDAGMVQGTSQSKPVSFDVAVKIGLIKLVDVPLAEQIEIIDATMACLLTWLEGHSLAQTVFTNLYANKPHEIEDRSLKAFMIGILKLISICGDVIRRAAICEEEDFQPATYNFYLCDDMSDTRVLGMLKEADDDCQKTIRSIKGKEATDEAQKNIDLNDAVSSRLRLLRHLFAAILALTGGRYDQKPWSLMKSNSPRSQSFEDAHRALEQCKPLIDRISDSSITGQESTDDENEAYEALPCFVPNLNQRLLPPTFPRKAKLLSTKAAMEYLRKLCQQLLVCCQLPQRAGSFDCTLEFFRDFSRKENCLLSRSVLQVAYHVVRLAKFPLADAVKEAMKEFIQPPVLQPKCALSNDPQCQETWDAFMISCCRVLPELIRSCGYNRARQRDRLATVLEDLASFQEEADRVDGLLHTVLNRSHQPPASLTRHHLACLGSFVLYHVMLVMLEYLFLGFELELYAVHEYASMYWYAHEFLYKWLINVLHKADNFIFEQEQASNKLEKSKGEKKKKTSKKKTALKTHRIQIVQLQAKQKLCDGYYRAMLGFYSLGRIRVPSFAGGDDYNMIRYEHRLAPFAHLATPPMIGYNQFLDISGFKDLIKTMPANRLFADAAQCFDEARLTLENIPSADESENAVLIRICKMNVIILRLLSSGHKSDAKEWPIFDFECHRNFPIIRLK